MNLLEVAIAVLMLCIFFTTFVVGVHNHGKIKSIAMSLLLCQIVAFVWIITL